MIARFKADLQDHRFVQEMDLEGQLAENIIFKGVYEAMGSIKRQNHIDLAIFLSELLKSEFLDEFII